MQGTYFFLVLKWSRAFPTILETFYHIVVSWQVLARLINMPQCVASRANSAAWCVTVRPLLRYSKQSVNRTVVFSLTLLRASCENFLASWKITFCFNLLPKIVQSWNDMTVSIQDFFKVTAANFDFENSQLYVIKIARHVWRLSFASFKKVCNYVQDEFLM